MWDEQTKCPAEPGAALREYSKLKEQAAGFDDVREQTDDENLLYEGSEIRSVWEHLRKNIWKRRSDKETPNTANRNR